ncbi:hypothetical protein [Lactococcus fujiensis]|uniref:hypothetical protein n=1 Tax=Lactococcus fujiensis TaxID=610251 RepID=UPI0006D24839|nr:hypothetical protein [Lactococcus fujiensis]
MNLPSFILLALILTATALTIRKIVHSKGACEDCSSNTCPVKSAVPISTTLENSHKDSCSCEE